MSDGALLTIGQVVDQLKADFPDLSITKVRYLEDRGLLAPSRTAGRYRKYSGADLRRLRTILTLQRDQYLPLEVIRERVETPSAVLGQQLQASARLGGAAGLKREDAVYTQEEFCENAGIDADLSADAHRVPAHRPQGTAGAGIHRQRPGNGAHLPVDGPLWGRTA